MTHYIPNPFDTSDVELPPEITGLIESLSKNIHDVWAKKRLSDSWSYGECRDDKQLRHPSLVPYDQLPETEKEYDRHTVTETLKCILALGFEIRPLRNL